MNDSTDLQKEIETLDRAKLLEELSPDIEKKAEQIAEQKLQERLSSLAGTAERDEWGFTARDSQGRPAPKSWDEGAKVIASKAKQEALTEFEKKLEERENRKKQEEKKRLEQQREESQRQYSQWDKDWQALVEEGELPGMSEEAQKKLKAGLLSDDEALKDQGLKARYDLLQAAVDHRKRTGEDINLYRFYKTQYKNEPGMSAPVTGSSRGFTPQQPEPDYDEIKRLREIASRQR